MPKNADAYCLMITASSGSGATCGISSRSSPGWSSASSTRALTFSDEQPRIDGAGPVVHGSVDHRHADVPGRGQQRAADLDRSGRPEIERAARR